MVRSHYAAVERLRQPHFVKCAQSPGSKATVKIGVLRTFGETRIGVEYAVKLHYLKGFQLHRNMRCGRMRRENGERREKENSRHTVRYWTDWRIDCKTDA